MFMTKKIIFLLSKYVAELVMCEIKFVGLDYLHVKGRV